MNEVRTTLHPQRYPKHADPEKGQVFDGICNRTACDCRGARWWNMGTFGFYCSTDAREINKANRGKPPLCVLVDAKPAVADMEKFRRDNGYYEIFAIASAESSS